jgi:hypothetical protein
MQAAILVMHCLDDYTAFSCLANVVSRPLFQCLFRSNDPFKAACLQAKKKSLFIGIFGHGCLIKTRQTDACRQKRKSSLYMPLKSPLDRRLQGCVPAGTRHPFAKVLFACLDAVHLPGL